jgi:heme/copper-type cytochrome/quinol oxidase subunit 2
VIADDTAAHGSSGLKESTSSGTPTVVIVVVVVVVVVIAAIVAVFIYRRWSRNREVDGPVQESGELDDPIYGRTDQ